MEMRNPPALQLVSIYMCIVFINEVDSPNGGLTNGKQKITFSKSKRLRRLVFQSAMIITG
jgi:hypothetical protein